MKIYARLPAMLLALVLSACGGGSEVASVAALPAALPAASLSGVAATGAPVAGGTVTVQCAAGADAGSTTAANGAWTVDVTGRSFPCTVKVTGGSPAGTIYSFALGTGTLNVTPLTDLAFATAAGTDPASWAAAHSTNFAASLAALALRLPAAMAALKANLTASGYTVPDGDLFVAAFTAAPGDRHDDLLEALKASLADSGHTYSELVASAASAGTGTLAIPFTRYITTAEVASIPKLNSSSLSITGDALTMKTNVTLASAKGAYIGGGVGNKAIMEFPGLAGTRVADIKSLALELQMVAHDTGSPGVYGNAPYLNFLIDLNCDASALSGTTTIAQAQARRRHLVFNPNYQASGAVSTTTFVSMEGTNTTVAWAMSGNPTLGMQLNASGAPLGTLSFDLSAYPNACIVDGVSADNGTWRDKTADPLCNTALALPGTEPAKCGRPYKGVLLNLGDSNNLFNMEWKVKRVRINDKTFRFKQ